VSPRKVMARHVTSCIHIAYSNALILNFSVNWPAFFVVVVFLC
jgi:hypothetical protein